VVASEQTTATAWTSQYGVTDAERKANRRVARLVPLVPLVVIVAVGVIAAVAFVALGSTTLGVVVACASVVLGGLVVAAGLLAAPMHLERDLGAVRVPDGSAPRIENLVGGLCATLGVGHPPLYVIEDARINLAMVSTSSGAAMVVTRGLLDGLDLIELEGVVAHGLAHVRLESVKRGTLAATMPSFLGNDAVRHRLAGRGRLLRADEVAAAAVRYPVGIAAVLERCVAQPPPATTSLFRTERFARMRWLWFDPLPDDETAVEDEVDAPAVRAQALAEW
jgi:heat shock protein HtpX